MDPNATLDEMRRIVAHQDGDNEEEGDAARMAELFEALDGWITNGGFLPADWRRAS